AGIDDVVEQDAATALDIADDVHHLALAGLRTALVDNGQVGVEPLRQRAGAHHAADVGRDDHQVVALAVVFLDVLRQHRRRHQIVGRDVEEALDLARVQIHGEHPVRSGAGDEVRHQLGRDRRAAVGLPVLSGVAVVGHHRRDPLRRRPHQGVGHDQQLHQVVVGRIAGRLDDEDVLAADVLLDHREHLVVREPLHLRLGQGHVQVVADGAGQRPVGVACEQLHGRSSFRRHRPATCRGALARFISGDAPPTRRGACFCCASLRIGAGLSAGVEIASRFRGRRRAAPAGLQVEVALSATKFRTGLILSAVAVSALTISACAGRGNRPRLAYEERPVEALYNTGYQRLESRRWGDAIDYFQEVERQHPYSEWSRRAILMQIYAHYQSNDYAEAIAASDRFISLFPGNPSAPYAFYMKALCNFEQNTDVGRNQGYAQAALDGLRDVPRRYPGTSYPIDARFKIDMVNYQLAGKEMSIGRYY